MLNHIIASPSMLPGRGLRALVCLSVLIFGASHASALPRVPVDPMPGLLPIQGGPPGAEQQAHEARPAPFAELDEVLRATRATLEELTDATARVAADTRRHHEMQALEKENQRLAVELEEARARRTDLERSRELTEARIAELTKTIDAARRESVRLDEALATLRGQNEQLDQRLSRADAARLAALGEVRQTQAEMANKLKGASDEVKQAKAELFSRREELEINHQKLAEANGAREQIRARVSAMEKRLKRSSAEAERVRLELAEAKEQLAQAAAAAVEAERARQAAGREADRLRSDAEEARKELAAATTEGARLQIANAELERQVGSLQANLRAATATARQNLIVMQEQIEELNAALDLAQSEKAESTPSPQAKPDALEPEPDATLPQAPSAMTEPPAPELGHAVKPSSVGPTAAGIEDAPVKTANVELEKLIDSLVDADPAPPAPTVRDPAASQAPLETAQSPAPGAVSQIDTDRLAGSATKLAMAEPKGSPSVDSGLARFNADLQALNELELNAAGSALFSGVESANGREVRVSTTAAWDSLPLVGQESYLDSLLGSWVAARGGKGSAVVQIVDSRGQVLVEKSWP
jgi:predicted  nucleic acid-binding Zn-ribbon protein